jgi:exosortase A
MTSAPLPQRAAISNVGTSRRAWRIAVGFLAIGLACFAAIFHLEISTAIHVWINSDTYGHCFLVLPAAAYLAWERRDLATASSPRPTPWMGLLAMPAAAAWFVAQRLGIMEGRQLMAMTMLQVMVASILGLRTWRAFAAAPMLYLYFMVPFGEFFVSPLQTLAVQFTTAGLDLVGIPNFSDGVDIETPDGAFAVYQACSGIKFLVATTVFAVLYACLIYTSFLRRLLFVMLALAVAVIGNDLRVLGIILVAHFIGDAQASVSHHLLSGWVFYIILGSLLVLIGLPFRQDRHLPTQGTAPVLGPITGASIIALTPIVLLAAMLRLAAGFLDRPDGATPVAAQAETLELPGCLRTPVLTAAPAYVAESASVSVISYSSAYRCGGDLFMLTMYLYPARISVRPLFLSLRAAEEPIDSSIIVKSNDFRAGGGPEAPVWRVTKTKDASRHYVVIATALWLNGRPSTTGMSARLDQALNTVRSSAVSPVLVVVTNLDSSQRALDSFLFAESMPLSQWIDKFLTRQKATIAAR